MEAEMITANTLKSFLVSHYHIHKTLAADLAASIPLQGFTHSPGQPVHRS